MRADMGGPAPRPAVPTCPQPPWLCRATRPRARSGCRTLPAATRRSAQPGRARLLRREAADGFGGAHYRAHAGDGEDHARKSGLQSRPVRLDPGQTCARLMSKAAPTTPATSMQTGATAEHPPAQLEHPRPPFNPPFSHCFEVSTCSAAGARATVPSSPPSDAGTKCWTTRDKSHRRPALPCGRG